MILQIVRYPSGMVIVLLRICLPFLGRTLFCILVLPSELFLDLFLAYTCLVLVMVCLFRMLYPGVDCLILLRF